MNTVGAVPVVAAFSGTEPPCRICGNHGASMTVSSLPNLGELLWRKCTRCGHGWHERLPPADAAHLPIGNHL